MKSFSLLTACLLITGLLTLSACVFAAPGPGARQADARQADARQADARDDHDSRRHGDGDKRCLSEDQRDGCQDREHH